MYFPGLSRTNCLAISKSQICGSKPKCVTSTSDSMSRWFTWAYAPAGDAWVTRVVVTTPVAFFASWAHWIIDVTRLASTLAPSQSPACTLAETPMVRKLVFTPHMYAVAVLAESGTCLSMQYVCKNEVLHRTHCVIMSEIVYSNYSTLGITSTENDIFPLRLWTLTRNGNLAPSLHHVALIPNINWALDISPFNQC